MTRRKPRQKARPPEPSRGWLDSHRSWIAGAILFVLAFLLRIFFWQATPDSSWPYSSFYRGDALNWLQCAGAIQRGLLLQDGLPLRPPGMAYLTALLWDGSMSGIGLLKFFWCLFGSLTVALFYSAVLRGFGFFVAALAGLAAACSTALMLLSTSLNNEMPYLLLVMAAFCLHHRLLGRPTLWVVAAWSVLQSLACLMRVEHVLFYASVLVFYFVIWLRGRGKVPSLGLRRCLTKAALSVILFLRPLVPWQIHAWRNIEKFNAVVRPSDEALTEEARRVEERIRDMEWDRASLEEKEELPGFVRRLASDFVAATVLHRGGQRVRAEDFRISRPSITATVWAGSGFALIPPAFSAWSGRSSRSSGRERPWASRDSTSPWDSRGFRGRWTWSFPGAEPTPVCGASWPRSFVFAESSWGEGGSFSIHGFSFWPPSS